MGGLQANKLLINATELREMLRKELRTDADFGAFLLDYFPEIYQRMGDGMERLAKENLFIALADAAVVIECLKRYRHRSIARIHPVQNYKYGLFGLMIIIFAFSVLGLLMTDWRYQFISVQRPPSKIDIATPQDRDTKQIFPSSGRLIPADVSMSEGQLTPAYIQPASSLKARSKNQKVEMSGSKSRLKERNMNHLSTDDLAHELNKAPSLD